MSVPILSIVIATKNRVPYCINCIETLLKLEDKDIQVIVQDNTDTLELKEYVEKNISDSRLIYNYTPPPFSSIDNFNACVALATGEYVCMIGDDDGINPEFLKIARIAKEKGIVSLGSSQIAEYYWPNALEKYKNGNLSIPSFEGTFISFDPKKRLIPLLMTGIVNYIPFNLPRVYHGLIKRDLLEKIKDKSGNYFGGLSPDIYSTIALTTLVEQHVLIDYPMTIAGTCGSSTSAASEKGEHSGRLEDAPHFRSRGNYIWEKEIPEYYSIQTIWAETGMKALKDFDQQHILKYFSLKFLVAQSVMNNRQIKKMIIEQAKMVIREQKKSITLFYAEISVLMLAIKLRSNAYKVLRKIKKKADTRIYYPGVRNVGTATNLLNEYMHKIKFNISDIFNTQ